MSVSLIKKESHEKYTKLTDEKDLSPERLKMLTFKQYLVFQKNTIKEKNTAKQFFRIEKLKHLNKN